MIGGTFGLHDTSCRTGVGAAGRCAQLPGSNDLIGRGDWAYGMAPITNPGYKSRGLLTSNAKRLVIGCLKVAQDLVAAACRIIQGSC